MHRIANSLDSLVDNIYDGQQRYNNFRHSHTQYGDQMGLLANKGVYPYEFLYSIEQWTM